MKTMLFLALAVLLLAMPAAAQIGVQAGVGRDWVKLDSADDYTELASPLAGASYDVPMDDNETRGLTVGYKASQDIALISQYIMEGWWVSYGGRVEWFGGAQFETWNRSDVLPGTTFLGGGRAGLRFEVQGLPFEVSGNYSAGEGGARRAGMFFGARVIDQ
jgi:hypothetical protein